jgi:copper transporter 1
MTMTSATTGMSPTTAAMAMPSATGPSMGGMGGMDMGGGQCKISVSRFVYRTLSKSRLTSNRCCGTGTRSMLVSYRASFVERALAPRSPRSGPQKSVMAVGHTRWIYYTACWCIAANVARAFEDSYRRLFIFTTFSLTQTLGFIARSWRVKSQAAFAGSCIGVILLVIILEFLRRAGKEYDRYIVANHSKTLQSAASSASSVDGPSGNIKQLTTTAIASPVVPAPRFRPNILQQAFRALLHTLQFAVAYFVMLLAMYYNGYIIICIFIGAYIGYFIFGYESFNVSQRGGDRMQENATVCCG